ncbi:hypothetical protein HDV02_002791 [Globomyces sp. JEL0801]|nr:hypothetical protein HDV02_002791 [Globomyces sp. JEL0801]
MLTPGFGNWIKRTARQAVFIAPPLAFYYYLHIWADKKYEYYNRKEYLRTVEADE